MIKGIVFYLGFTAVILVLSVFVLTCRQEQRIQKRSPAGMISRKQGVSRLCLGTLFVLLFLLSALRLEVGNDYGTYTDVIHEIYVGGYVVTEPLFNGIVKALCFLSGGENYLLVFAFFAGITQWLFLKVIREQSEHFFAAVYLFMTLGIYFRTFNTVRYYFVLAITLYSFRFVLRKEYGKFLLLIGLGALFHKSVLAVIPLYWLANRRWKKETAVVFGFLGILAIFFQKEILQLALFFYPSYRDTIYLQQGVGLGENLLIILRCLAVFFLSLFCLRKGVKLSLETGFYFRLNLLAIGLYGFGSFLPLIGRIGYYLITSHILFLPALLGGIEDKGIRRKLTLAVGLVCLAYYGYFLWTGNQEGVRILPYKSWLFYEKDFLNAGEIF